MKALDRKLLRELGRLKSQLFAIVLVVACGIAAFVAMRGAHRSLERAMTEYYAATRFPDVFASLARAPTALTHRIAAIPGVSLVQTRVVKDVLLDVPGLSEPARGHMVSYPTDHPPALSDLHLRSGRWIRPGRADEVLVNDAFARANALELDATIGAVIGGRRQQLRIVGTVLSPEYIYHTSSGTPWPDDRRSGVLWIDEDALAAAFDMTGAFNDVALRLAPGFDPRPVRDALDLVLEPYGCPGSVARDRQASHRFLADRLVLIKTQSFAIPAVFLFVAAFLLNVVLGRLIAGQREEVAALKALGYSDLRIGLHYLELVLLVVFLGTAVGTALGVWAGTAMMTLYQRFFSFPALPFRLGPDDIVLAALISGAAGIVGTAKTVLGVVRLPPAEAMRPPAPPAYKKSLLDRAGVHGMLAPPARMILRNLERRPWQALISALGVGMAIAIILLSRSLMDSMNMVMETSFQRSQRHDVAVGFARPEHDRAVRELSHVPGVLYAEPSRSVPVRLVSGSVRYESAIQGLPPGGQLKRLLDADQRIHALPPEGVVLTRELGKRLGVGPGDRLLVEVLEGEPRSYGVGVAALLDETMGMQVYMDMRALGRMLGEGPRVSGALLLVDPQRRDEVYLALKELPGVAAATLRSSSWALFKTTTGDLQTTQSLILAFCASVIAMGVVYNSARIALSERARELASLRVLGFTRVEISTIFLGELAVQLGLGIPIGWWLGYMGSSALSKSIDAETMRLPSVIVPGTYLLAAAFVAAASILAALLVRRRLDHLDLVAVLKTRD